MAEYREEWEFEIDNIFLSDNLEEIVEGTRSFFHKMKLGASQEQDKIGYWLSCAYQHKEVNRNPFFPILFLYAVCENEEFSDEKITRYMKYAVQYVYNVDGELENELKNGWLKNHRGKLPPEHQKVARIYQEIVDCLYPEYESDLERNIENGSYGWQKKWGEDGPYNESDNGNSEDVLRQGNASQYAEEVREDEREQKREHKGSSKSSKKGLLIGLVAGLLIGATLGCTGTAYVLNRHFEAESQKNELQTPSQTPLSPSDSSPSHSTSEDNASGNSSDNSSDNSSNVSSSSLEGTGNNGKGTDNPGSSEGTGNAGGNESSGNTSSSEDTGRKESSGESDSSPEQSAGTTGQGDTVSSSSDREV